MGKGTNPMTEDESLASDITLLAGIRDSGGKHACERALDRLLQ